MNAAFALEVLDKAPYVTVSFTRPDGTPYGVPLSLARTDDKTFYFHCALEGDKLDCIAANPTVALSWKKAMVRTNRLVASSAISLSYPPLSLPTRRYMMVSGQTTPCPTMSFIV